MAKKFAWSYSALTGFETCPYQHYRLRVKKDIYEKPSRAMEFGNYAHKALERRVTRGKPLPGDLQQYEPLVRRFAEARLEGTDVRCEMKVALNDALEVTEYFAPDTWARFVYDVAVFMPDGSLSIYDYKTGKRKVDNDQLDLFAASAFSAFPEVQTVKTYFIWLPDKKIDKDEFTREQEPLIWRDFEPRVERMAESYRTNYFPCKPSGLCRGWCPVKDCEHWEGKK